MLKKNVTLTGKFSYMTAFLLSAILLMTVLFSGYSVYIYLSSIGKNVDNFDTLLKNNVEVSMKSSFDEMASLRDWVDILLSSGVENGDESAHIALGNYKYSTLSDCAVIRSTGEVITGTPDFGKQPVEVMTVSGKKEFTIKNPVQHPVSMDMVVPVFLPLKKAGGYLNILWKPSVVSEKIVPWIGSALYSADGTLLDSNVPGMITSISSSRLNGGKVEVENGTGHSSLINLPDGETSWWTLMVVENKGMLSEALGGLIPIAIILPVFLILILIPFHKLKKEVLDDLIFIRDIIKEFHSRGKVDVRIFQHARSHEVRQLGKMFIQMSEQINNSIVTLKSQADKDALTGLPNRMSMEKELQNRIDREEMFSILFLDLDGFKPVNDNFGHDIGDIVLQLIGQKLMETFRNKDFVCRWGGDEFVVCLYGDVEPVIPKLITRIRGKLSEININAISGKEDLPPYRIGTSVGISTYPSDGVGVDSLVQIADERMYEDKMSRKVGR